MWITCCSQNGGTIVSDGWSDPQRRPITNFMSITESKPTFLKEINFSMDLKDRIHCQIHEGGKYGGGPSNVMQTATNEIIVCKAAGLIEIELPSTHWTPCLVHTSNIALKNICTANNTEKVMMFTKKVFGSYKLRKMQSLSKIYHVSLNEVINFQIIKLVLCCLNKTYLHYCDTPEI